MFYCVFGPLLVHLCALCVPVQLYEIMMNHSSSQKTRLNNLSCGIKIWADFSPVVSQFTRLTDKQTGGQTDRQNSHRQTESAFHEAL